MLAAGAAARSCDGRISGSYKGTAAKAPGLAPGMATRDRANSQACSASAAMAGKAKWKADPWSGPGDTQRRPW